MALDVLPLHPIGDHRGPLAAQAIGWDDIQGSVSQGVGAAALTQNAFLDTPFQILCFRHDQDDSLSFIYQMPHRWKPGTSVRPHVHLVPLADPAAPQTIHFIGQYVWFGVGTPIPATVGWTPFTVDVVVNPGGINREAIAALPLILPPPTMVESAILAVYWQRNGTSVLDTYSTNKIGGTLAANVGLVSVDCHFQIEKDGTNPSEFFG